MLSCRPIVLVSLSKSYHPKFSLETLTVVRILLKNFPLLETLLFNMFFDPCELQDLFFTVGNNLNSTLIFELFQEPVKA